MAGGWESLGLLPELVRAVEEDFDWRLPTGIQDECIPLILGGGDVMGSAETGSGKTAAFALPLLQLCVEYKERQLQQDTAQKQQQQKDRDKPPDDASNVFVMSTQDRDSGVGIHPDSAGLRIQSKSDKKIWAGCRCSAGVALASSGNTTLGKYSFECQILDSDGTVRIGWSTADASLNLGTDRDGYGYGVKVHGNNYDPIGGGNKRIAFGKGDVIGCHLEVVLSTGNNNNNNNNRNNNNKRGGKGGGGNLVGIISFSKNGEFLGEAYDVTSNSDDLNLFPTVCFKNAECQLNFGTTKFQHSLPEGYKPLSSLAGKKNNSHLAINPRDVLASSHHGGNAQGPMVICIEPTRDLAQQTYRTFDDLSQKLYEYYDGNDKSCYKINSALLVGGVNPNETLKQIRDNTCDVLVGTPPIIASYMKNKKNTIHPHRCRFFVLDEADELITNDSIIPIQSIFGRLLAQSSSAARYDRLQVLFFSATLHSQEVRDLASQLCHRPLWVDLRGKNDSILPDTVHHIVINVNPSSYNMDKDYILSTDAVHRKGNLGNESTIRSSLQQMKKSDQKSYRSECIKQLKPRILLHVIDQFNMDQVLIFCRTNLDCDLMEQLFKDCQKGLYVGNAGAQASGGGRDIGLSDKYACRVLAGKRSMQEREQSLQDFKDGEVRILICTDVAARGIDIRELPFVINMTLPDTPEVYVHRIGRVGRAERIGLALSIVSLHNEERVWFCQKGKKPPVSDTRDYDKGGNCIWYKEPDYWKNIANLMEQNKKSFTKLEYPSGMTLPDEIEQMVTTGGYGNYAGGSSIDEQVQTKMKQMEQQVKQLSKTEILLQNDYWNITNYYNNKLGGGK